MPAALADVDREAVRAHVVTHGVREAARAFGLSENTVSAWSARGKWLADAGKAIVVQPLPKSMQAPASGASKPSVAARNSLERIGERSKLNLAKYVDRTAKHASTLRGEEALAAAPAVVSVAKVGQSIKLPGFESGSTSAAFLGLHVTVRADQAQAVDVEAVVERVDQSVQSGDGEG